MWWGSGNIKIEHQEGESPWIQNAVFYKELQSPKKGWKVNSVALQSMSGSRIKKMGGSRVLWKVWSGSTERGESPQESRYNCLSCVWTENFLKNVKSHASSSTQSLFLQCCSYLGMFVVQFVSFSRFIRKHLVQPPCKLSLAAQSNRRQKSAVTCRRPHN